MSKLCTGEPWENKPQFQSQISLKEESDALLIRIYGGGIPYVASATINQLFSIDHNNSNSLVTIGSPAGFTDKSLISNTLAEVQKSLPKSISKICIYHAMHGGLHDSQTGEFNLQINAADFLGQIPAVTISSDELFEQILPFAQFLSKPIDIISISCYGGNLHLSKKLSEFPIGTRLLTFSDETTPTNYMGLFSGESIDCPKLCTMKDNLFDQTIVLVGTRQHKSSSDIHNNMIITQVGKGGIIEPVLNFDIINHYVANTTSEQFKKNPFLNMSKELGIDVDDRVNQVQNLSSRKTLSKQDFCVTESSSTDTEVKNINYDNLYFASAMVYLDSQHGNETSLNSSILGETISPMETSY